MLYKNYSSQTFNLLQAEQHNACNFINPHQNEKKKGCLMVKPQIQSSLFVKNINFLVGNFESWTTN